MSDYFLQEDLDLEQEASPDVHGDLHDSRTPLERTIDRIGMGSYQWTLLSLCGFGWLADNMWIQAIAIILPRVQQHYSVPDSYIGALSSSMFAGMMFGAIGWGTCSDLLGRSTAFNATLFFTALFGLLASFANSFRGLCISLFFLGSAVGGSMPTDGTLLLEHIPKAKHHLVTALSVFFSLGAVLSAVVALLLLPQNSCPASSLPCDVDAQNKGWKYLLTALGLITLSMFLARIVFFRLHESPRYLVHAGRPHDAVKALQMISRFNGSDLSIELCDVVDNHYPAPDPRTQALSSTAIETPSVLIDPHHSTIPIAGNGRNINESSPLGTPPKVGAADIDHYRATGETVTPLSASQDRINSGEASIDEDMEGDREDAPLNPEPRRFPLHRGQSQPTFSAGSSRHITTRASLPPTFAAPNKKKTRLRNIFPRWLADPLNAWGDRMLMVLSPEWLNTTLLVWATWFWLSLAFTMFNVFLPKLLEYGPSARSVSEKRLEDSLWDVAIFTIGGCPGAILGAYLIESRLGRRWCLAGSTFLTAILCTVFTFAHSPWAVRLTAVGINLSATTMWAVLYGWTPEIFKTNVRGTACGIASALSRIGGMIAPLVGGMLLVIDRSIPVYTSVVAFVAAGSCVLLLREDNSPQKTGQRIVVH